MIEKSFERLTQANHNMLESKNLYFAGFSFANIRYFTKCFPQYTDDICGIFAVLDIDERTPLSTSIEGKNFNIRPLSEVISLNADEDVLIIMYEYEKEAYEKIHQIRKDAHIPVYWFADEATELELDYREKFSDYADEDIILFKSSSRQYVYGEDFNDNAKALFEYMLDSGYNRRWKLVWLVFDPACKDYDVWKKYENVEFIGAEDNKSGDKEKRELYYRNLCLAKYAFVTDDETFFRRRRSDQILVQLWHGDGIKARTRFRVMEKRFEYMVCTSRFFADVDYKDFGLRYDQMLPCGLPKDDWLFAVNDNVQLFAEELKGYEHYVLWAPTFRKVVEGLEILNENVDINETGLPMLRTWADCVHLNNKLKALNCLLVIKLHPVANLSIHAVKDFSNIRLMTNQELYSKGLHINQIMSLFDGFISDYSSAVTSYMVLDNPMAITLDDIDEYDNSRGFVLTPVRDYLPGDELYIAEDMENFIEEVCLGKDTSADKRHKVSSLMIDHRDGRNSERLLDMLGIVK